MLQNAAHISQEFQYIAASSHPFYPFKEIADYLLCDQSLYSKYERGERPLPLELAVRLAQFYGTSVDYLVGLTRNKTPYR